MIVAATIWHFLVLVWDVFTDVRKWKQNKTTKHREEAILRGLLLSPSYVVFAIECPSVMFVKIFLPAAMMFFSWWLLFNGLYNLHRSTPSLRFGFWHLGSKDKDESWFDELERKWPDWFRKPFKIIMAAATVTAYLIILLSCHFV